MYVGMVLVVMIYDGWNMGGQGATRCDRACVWVIAICQFLMIATLGVST
jgi:hypothetical protein